MSNVLLELYEKGNFVEFLSQVEGTTNPHEDVLLAKGVALLQTEQFSSASELFQLKSFETRQAEADVYQKAAHTCWVSSSLESGMQLMNDHNFEASLKVYTQMPLEDSTGELEEAMHQKYNNQACCLFYLNRFEEALEVLNSSDMRSILQKSQQSVIKQAENEYNIGLIQKRMHHDNLALQAFDTCIQLAKKTTGISCLVKVYLEKVDTLLQLNQYSEAISAIATSLFDLETYDVTPDMTARLVLQRAVAAIQLHYFDDALTDLASLSERASASPSLLQDVCQLKAYCLAKKGSVMFRHKDFQHSAETYEVALRVIAVMTTAPSTTSSPSSLSLSTLHVNILFNLAMTHMKLGRFDTAEQKFTYLTQLLADENSSSSSGSRVSAEDRDMYLFQAYVSLGQIMMQRAQALSREDEGEEEEREGGSQLTQQETYTLAVDAFKRAVALQPQKVPVVYSLGVAQVRSDLFSEAKQSFATILTIEPEHEEGLKAMAMSVSYEEALASTEILKQEQEQEQDEAAIEEAKALAEKQEKDDQEEKQRLREEEKAKKNSSSAPVASPPKVAYQSAAFRKFNSPQTSTTKSFDNKGNGYNRNSKPSSNNNSSNPSGVVEDKVQEKDTEKDTEKDKDTTTRSATDTTTDTDVDVCYPYEQLKSPGPYPPGVTADRELLLSAADFLTVFKVSKEEFAKFPGWKKISKKKAAGLF